MSPSSRSARPDDVHLELSDVEPIKSSGSDMQKHTGVSRAAKKHGAGREIPRELETIQEQLEQKTSDPARFAVRRSPFAVLLRPEDWKLRLSALKHLQGLVLGSHEVLRPVLPRCREALLNQALPGDAWDDVVRMGLNRW